VTYPTAQFGRRPWIVDAIREVAVEIEEKSPPAKVGDQD
jgi:hypothetical protein